MRERAATLLRASGSATACTNRPRKLSGGQQQRVAIARALVLNAAAGAGRRAHGQPRHAQAEQMFALLREHQSPNRAAAFLLVTHDPRLAARCARRIELVDGRVLDG